MSSSPFARHYSENSFLFLGILRCFSSPSALLPAYVFNRGCTGLPCAGFPIRKSLDRRLHTGFPELIAVCHVLHRLLAPRHPPYALSSLTHMKPRNCFCFAFYSAVKVPSLAHARVSPVAALDVPIKPNHQRPTRPKPISHKKTARLSEPYTTDARYTLPSTISFPNQPHPYPIRFVPPSPSPVEMRGLEPLASSVQRRRSPI